jgi:ABC-type multidrug transport system ATPase subunit
MELYVIAGPNGAGKTTFAREFLPNYADCRKLRQCRLDRARNGAFFARDRCLPSR